MIIAFEILAFIFIILTLLISIALVTFFTLYFKYKKKENQFKEKYNYMALVNFDVRQKIIALLADYNFQIEPICQYSINFKKEYQSQLEIISHDLKILANLNAKFSFKRAMELTKIIEKNFSIIEIALIKHDKILDEASYSFHAVSEITVFYQKTVNKLIATFEETISLGHNGSKISQLIGGISKLLVQLEENKTANDINEIEHAMTSLDERIKELLEYLNGVHLILMSDSYLKASIDVVERIVHGYVELKNGKELFLIEKKISQLRNYHRYIAEENFEYDVERKKSLIIESLKILKAINKKINYLISTKKTSEEVLELITNWINYFESNQKAHNKLFKNILQIIQSKDHKINKDFYNRIYRISSLINQIVKTKGFILKIDFSKEDSTNYINKIKEILQKAYAFKVLLTQLNSDLNYAFETSSTLVSLINSYKLSLIVIYGNWKQFSQQLKIPYNPVKLIGELTRIEANLASTINNEEKNAQYEDQIADIYNKIIEISATMSKNEKLLLYGKKLIIKLNKFYQYPKYQEALDVAISHYNTGNFQMMVSELINGYNSLSKRYLN